MCDARVRKLSLIRLGSAVKTGVRYIRRSSADVRSSRLKGGFGRSDVSSELILCAYWLR